MIIHDHFDGSAHCVECSGHCALTGEARAVTEFIRFTLDRLAYLGFREVPHFERRAMIALGLNPDLFMERALANTPRDQPVKRNASKALSPATMGAGEQAESLQVNPKKDSV